MSEPSKLSVTVIKPGETLVAICGEFDVLVTTTLIEAVTPHVDGRITVDLGGVTFMDSSALHCVLRLREQVHAAGGTLQLGSVSYPVLRLFSLAGLHHILSIDD